MVLRSLERTLAPEHDVRCFSDAGQALTALGSDPDYDVILCDLMMPNMNGIEFFASLLRQNPALAERVVFLTGGAFTEQADAFLADKRSVAKPFVPEEIRQLVRRIVL